MGILTKDIPVYTMCRSTFFPLCPKDSVDFCSVCFHPRFPPCLQEKDKHRLNKLHWLPYFALKLLNNHFECRDEQKEMRNSFLEFLKIICFLFFNEKWLSGKQEREDVNIWALEIFLRKQMGMKQEHVTIFSKNFM